MKKHCQLLIIGAGPAGAYAALTAARNGIDTVLIERSNEIGKPLCCAEATSHEGLSHFVEIKSEFVSTQIKSINLTVTGGAEVTYSPEHVYGYVLDRPVFQKYLVEKALEKGAELLMESSANRISIENGKPAKVSIQTKTSQYIIYADYVIAADGVESRIGKMAGIDTGLKLTQCETALQYRISDIELAPDRINFYVGDSYSPNGYLWVFPKSENSANIGVGLNPAKADNRLLRKLLNDFIGKNFPGGKIQFESCGMVPKFTGFDILGRENLLLAGDAARMIDSLSGAGIARALHTGKLAAEIICEAINSNMERNEFQKKYRCIVEKEIGRELKVFAKAYPIFRKFTNSDWEQLVLFLKKIIKNNEVESMDPTSIIIKAITSAPGLLKLARHVF